MSASLKVAVTPRSLSAGDHPSLDRLRSEGFELVFPAPGRIPTGEELLVSIPDCAGYLAGTEPIGPELIAASPRLKVIARNGVGVDGIDTAAAERRGIRVLTAPAANAQGVAELAIALLFAGLRQLPWHDGRLKAGDWARRPGLEAKGRTLGVIGCGQIGQRVTTMALGLGMSVVAFDAYPSESFRPDGAFRWAGLSELLAASDVLTLHAPPPASGPLLGSAEFAIVKPGVHLVNTARAALVDPDALLAALESGRVAGYATDVFDHEPPEPSALLAHSRVITTPHLGGYTMESVGRAADAAVENLLRVLRDAS